MAPSSISRITKKNSKPQSDLCLQSAVGITSTLLVMLIVYLGYLFLLHWRNGRERAREEFSSEDKDTVDLLIEDSDYQDVVRDWKQTPSGQVAHPGLLTQQGQDIALYHHAQKKPCTVGGVEMKAGWRAVEGTETDNRVVCETGMADAAVRNNCRQSNPTFSGHSGAVSDVYIDPVEGTCRVVLNKNASDAEMERLKSSTQVVDNIWSGIEDKLQQVEALERQAEQLEEEIQDTREQKREKSEALQELARAKEELRQKKRELRSDVKSIQWPMVAEETRDVEVFESGRFDILVVGAGGQGGYGNRNSTGGGGSGGEVTIRRRVRLDKGMYSAKVGSSSGSSSSFVLDEGSSGGTSVSVTARGGRRGRLSGGGSARGSSGKGGDPGGGSGSRGQTVTIGGIQFKVAGGGGGGSGGRGRHGGGDGGRSAGDSGQDGAPATGGGGGGGASGNWFQFSGNGGSGLVVLAPSEEEEEEEGGGSSSYTCAIQ